MAWGKIYDFPPRGRIYLKPFFPSKDVMVGWPRSTVEKGPQSNESYERENPWNRTVSTVLWVHKKLPQSTVKLVLPSNENYESRTGCNRTLATVLWRMAKGGAQKGGFENALFNLENPWKIPENTLIFESRYFQAFFMAPLPRKMHEKCLKNAWKMPGKPLIQKSGCFQIPPFMPPPFAILWVLWVPLIWALSRSLLVRWGPLGMSVGHHVVTHGIGALFFSFGTDWDQVLGTYWRKFKGQHN